MRKFFLLATILAVAAAAAIGVAIALGVHWAVTSGGTTFAIDGETFDGPLMALVVGGAAVLGIAIAATFAVTLLASVALAIPLLLVLALGAILMATLVGVAPLLVPVLLVVGAYVLLSRRAKRRATALSQAPTVSSTPTSNA